MFDALQANARRRLVVVRMDGVAEPPELKHYEVFARRLDSIELDADAADAADRVRRSAFPDDIQKTSTAAEAELAEKLIAKIRAGKNLVIIVGPYAFAEAAVRLATPSNTIRGFLRARKLRGYAPWLDVMGSIARATAADEDDAAKAVVTAMSDGTTESGLGVYLRLLAANWARTPGTGRLFIVATSPDYRTDMALRSAGLPVEHLRLIHHPREADRLLAERVIVRNGRPVVSALGSNDKIFDDDDRVVLIKPFGCVETAKQALLTAEHWRQASMGMPLPDTVAGHMSHAMLLALGAGAFAPSFQFLFSLLLPKALADLDGNAHRYLFHNPDARVIDPLHRIEAAVLKSPEVDFFQTWLTNTYKLYLRRGDPVALLSWLEHYLNQP